MMSVTNEAIINADALTLGTWIQQRKVTSFQAVKAYIEKIEEMNPTLNFFVEARFDEALKEAVAIDTLLAKGEGTGRLLGVPMSMKESFHVENMHTTGGLVNRKDAIQHNDADIVAKLKAEGAIILGKTNTPSLCFCQETDNKLFGRTNNPWDVSKTVGGSSGGEGVAIAIGAAAAGIGSDIGGSIRFPSHFNGVIGFKSGNGRVSSVGSFPPENEPLQQRMLGIGPMTKSVEDAELIYSIIAKEQPIMKNVRDFTMSFIPKMNYPLSAETVKIMEDIRNYLSASYDTVCSIPPYFDETATLWQEMMSINGSKDNMELAFGNKTPSPIGTFVKERLTGNTDMHRYLSWAFIGSNLFKPTEQRVREIEQQMVEGDKVIETYLDKTIIVSPVYHSAATKHGKVYSEIFSIRKTYKEYLPYIAYANVWGLPALTIPVGTDASGMPIGIQLMSMNGNESVLFRLGRKIEQQYRGYKRFQPL